MLLLANNIVPPQLINTLGENSCLGFYSFRRRLGSSLPWVHQQPLYPFALSPSVAEPRIMRQLASSSRSGKSREGESCGNGLPPIDAFPPSGNL
jgi:hypothetical protein